MAQWQIFGAVALRRLPIVSPPMDFIEQKVSDIFKEYEIARSILSKHEADKVNEKKVNEEKESEILLKESTQDIEDKWAKDAANFTFKSYEEESSLVKYLLVNQRLGTDIKEQWLPPQTHYDSKIDKTLIDTCQRAIKDHLNIINGYRIISKVPSAVSSFKYPKKVQDMTGFKGAKIFFLKAHLENPDIQVIEALNDKLNKKLKWSSFNEMRNVVHKSYFRDMMKGMFHEKRVDVDKVLASAAKSALLR